MKISVVGKMRRLFTLAFIILTIFAPIKAYAESVSGSTGLSGRVASVPPNVAPVISQPIDQTHIHESPVMVSGSCQNNLLIKVYVNEVFSGAVVCTDSKFTVEVDLFSGSNEIIARGFDSLDQATPDSNIITVHLESDSSNLRLTSDYARRSVNPGDKLSWPINVAGGKSPYAVSIDWGDDSTSLKSVLAAGDINIEHIYKYSGIYKVVVRAVDIEDSRAILHLVAISNGTIKVSDTSTNCKEKTTVLWWPMVLFIIFIISAFWLGRRYEQLLNNKN